MFPMLLTATFVLLAVLAPRFGADSSDHRVDLGHRRATWPAHPDEDSSL